MRSGLLALVPFHTKEGDICSIVRGVSVPLILRPSRRATYQLVGECFVADAMNGSLIEKRDEEKIEDELIVLE